MLKAGLDLGDRSERCQLVPATDERAHVPKRTTNPERRFLAARSARPQSRWLASFRRVNEPAASDETHARLRRAFAKKGS
jgi:hypothetical protein